MGAPAAAQIWVSPTKLMPVPSTDGDPGARAARAHLDGSLWTPFAQPSSYGQVKEGAWCTATNATPGTALAYSITTAFADTTPYLYIVNGDATRDLYLDKIKLLVTVAPASTTQVRWCMYMQPNTAGLRAPTTDNMTALTAITTNGGSVLTAPTIKVQSSATASVVPASDSTTRKLVGNGNLGGLPVIGDALEIEFGKNTSGGSRTSTVAGKQCDSSCGVIIKPAWNLIMHLWFVSNAATGLSAEPTIDMFYAN